MLCYCKGFFFFCFSSTFGIVHLLRMIALQKSYGKIDGKKLSYDMDMCGENPLMSKCVF